MIKFPILHSFEPTESLKHNHTPKKAAVLSTVSYLENHHIYLRKRDIFRHFDIPNRTGFRWITKNKPRRLYNRPDSGSDLHGQKRKLAHNNLRKIEDFLSGKFKCRILN